MIRRFSDAIGIRDRSERRVWRRGRWLTVALTITVTVLAACGDGSADGGEGDGTDAERIVIKTRVKMFTGTVLAGSIIGDSPFCPGGAVRHEHGSPEIGFPAINVFRCPDGQLKIGFGPGPDQMNNAVQTSYWEVLDGNGRFAGMSGDGQMIVRWERAGSPIGQETFTGMVVVP